ncbi:hypothetical protein BDV12DRAFT_194006 [Aspergillus spectabilis]
MSSVLYGWANDILRHNPQQRAIILVVMNTLPTSIRAWIGLFVFKTVEAPRFTKGYSFCLANSVVLIGWTVIVKYLYEKEETRVRESATPTDEVEQVTHIPVKSDGELDTSALEKAQRV